MCKGGSQNSKTTTTASIDPTVKANYQSVVQQAQQAAQTPLNPATYQQVAGLTPDQQAAFQGINALQGSYQPYLNTAAGYAAQGAAPVAQNLPQYNQQTLAQYQSPYIQDVVNATQANINQSNAVQQQQLLSNAIQSGASPFGGDRAGIAASELARNQNLASQQTIAGLYNQGFTNAQQALQGQQQLQLTAQNADAQRAQQAAEQFANLGTTALGAGLTASQAQLQSGTLQQQQAQNVLNAGTQNAQSQQMYPFQTTGWLANIIEGLGNQGGTTTSQAPQPSTASQIGGGLTAGLGILGATGAFGSSGWLSSLFKDGGDVGGGLNDDQLTDIRDSDNHAGFPQVYDTSVNNMRNDNTFYKMSGLTGVPGLEPMASGGAARNGRFGDTEVLHVNPREKALVVPILKALGGAGTHNPKDGGLEFYEDAGGEGGHGGPAGQGGHNDVGGGRGGNGGGGNGNGGGGANFGGTRVGNENAAQGVANAHNMGRDITGGSSRPAGGGGAGPMGNDVTTTYSRALQNPNFASQYDPSQASINYGSAYGQYNAPGLGAWAARHLGFMGFGEVAPREDQPSSYASGDYHFGVNPAGLVGGIVGAATGVPLVGTLAGAGYDAIGGKSIVLGGPGGLFSGSGTSAPAGSLGAQPGGKTGDAGATPGSLGATAPASAVTGTAPAGSGTPAATQTAAPVTAPSAVATGSQYEKGVIPFTFNAAPGYPGIQIPTMHPMVASNSYADGGTIPHMQLGGVFDPSQIDSELDSSPQMDTTGQTVQVRYPSEQEALDTGLPVQQQSFGSQTINDSMSSPWMALTDIGLGILASRSPYVGQAIGEGALTGLGTYQQQKAQQIENAYRQQQLKSAQQQYSIQQQALQSYGKIRQLLAGQQLAAPVASPAAASSVQPSAVPLGNNQTMATSGNAPVPGGAIQAQPLGAPPVSQVPAQTMTQGQPVAPQSGLAAPEPQLAPPNVATVDQNGRQVPGVIMPSENGGAQPLVDIPRMIQMANILYQSPLAEDRNQANQIMTTVKGYAPPGTMFSSDGKLYPIPGANKAYFQKSIAEKGILEDPNNPGSYYIPATVIQSEAKEKGAIAGAEQGARNASDLYYRPRIAGAEAWAKAPSEVWVQQNTPRVLGEGQTVEANGAPIMSVPKIVDSVDASGAHHPAVMPVPVVTNFGQQGANAPTVNQQTGAPTSVPQGGMVQPAGTFPTSQKAPAGLPQAPSQVGGITTQLGPLQQSSLEHRAATLEEQGKQIDQDANNAKQTEFLVDQMRRDMGTWDQGKFASQKENAKAYLQSAAKMMGVATPDLDNEIGDFQAFQKNATRLTTQATKEVSSRAAFQEMQMISHAQPNADMSKGGLNQVFNQIYSIADFQQAKQQASQDWRASHGGTLDGFETDWNKNVTPGAFLVTRMSPQDLQAMAAKMQSLPDGREALARLKAEVMWAQQHGLVQ